MIGGEELHSGSQVDRRIGKLQALRGTGEGEQGSIATKVRQKGLDESNDEYRLKILSLMNWIAV